MHPTYCGKLVEGYTKRLTQVNLLNLWGRYFIIGLKNVPVLRAVFCHKKMLDYAYN
jgi:hypothetical protein